MFNLCKRKSMWDRRTTLTYTYITIIASVRTALRCSRRGNFLFGDPLFILIFESRTVHDIPETLGQYITEWHICKCIYFIIMSTGSRPCLRHV